MFVSQQDDRSRIPVALLSGTLGSGKTTLLNALLRAPRLADTAVAINEFGAVPIDHDLIDHGDDKTLVLANGCLCCNLAGDMEEAVMRLHARRQAGEVPRFARLIIEPSGLADPAPIAQAILRNPLLARVLRLDGIYTVADAVLVAHWLRTEPTAATQILLADKIVLTKIDLSGEEAAAAAKTELRALNGVATILDASFGRIDAAALFTAGFFDPRADFEPHGALRSHPHRKHGIGAHATVLMTVQPLDWRDFDGWLRGLRLALKDKLLRVKGLVRVAGSAGPIVVQGVHHVLHPPVELERWPGDDRRTRLVLITRDVAETELRKAWAGLVPTASPVMCS